MCWEDFLNENRVRRSQVDHKRKDISGSTDNRNPLTHSLEVMNIGLSFAIYLSGNEKFKEVTKLTSEDVLRKVSPILKTACLVHDIGNPPFGHFGEEVIQEYFKNLLFYLKHEDISENELSKHILKGIRETLYFKQDGKNIDEEIQKRCVDKQLSELKKFLDNPQLKYDYTQFDGNAEGFRILTKLQYLGDLTGLNLTFATLSSILKYPNYNEGNKGDDNIGKGHDTRSLLQIIDVQIVADARRQPPFAYSIEYIYAPKPSSKDP